MGGSGRIWKGSTTGRARTYVSISDGEDPSRASGGRGFGRVPARASAGGVAARPLRRVVAHRARRVRAARLLDRGGDDVARAGAAGLGSHGGGGGRPRPVRVRVDVEGSDRDGNRPRGQGARGAGHRIAARGDRLPRRSRLVAAASHRWVASRRQGIVPSRRVLRMGGVAPGRSTRAFRAAIGAGALQSGIRRAGASCDAARSGRRRDPLPDMAPGGDPQGRPRSRSRGRRVGARPRTAPGAGRGRQRASRW